MRRDLRLYTALLVLSTALVAGGALNWLPQRTKRVATASPPPAAAPAAPAYAGELHERFQQAAAMLHAGRHADALTALERVLALAPDLPEAHVNAGFALLGLERSAQARTHFDTAIALRPMQANAYYGLALAWDAIGDPAAALGAMRTYVHLAPEASPHLRRARAAIWEWEAARGEADLPQRLNSAGEGVTHGADRG